jgi:hypothetical protein
MTMKLNVSVNKKIGQPDFGSLGASCGVEVELPHNIVFDDLEAFHRHARNVYVAATQAVNDELARHQQGSGTASHATNNATNSQAAQSSQQNGSNGNGQHANGNGQRNGTSGHGASEKQLGYARQLAKSIQGLGIRRLETLAQKLYGKPLVGLTTMDASGLIDTLKSIKDGTISLDAALEGTAA